MGVGEQALPSSLPGQTYVRVSVLQAGHLTLPERFFVSPANPQARRTVPSLSFLIEHPNDDGSKPTRILLDLGLRRDLERYALPIRQHAATRAPISSSPDVTSSLARGELYPSDIDYVVLSHVHWDHIGEPLDFPTSTFVVGSGALDLLNQTSQTLSGGHSHFEANLLPAARTIELAPTCQSPGMSPGSCSSRGENDCMWAGAWEPIWPFDHAMDVFSDGSLYLVDSPGHLPGHVNFLARKSATEFVYLAGDACHDRRILRNELAIGEWTDDNGHLCCIHADKEVAEETIKRIRIMEKGGNVEIILAHDVEWEESVLNKDRMFPNPL